MKKLNWLILILLLISLLPYPSQRAVGLGDTDAENIPAVVTTDFVTYIPLTGRLFSGEPVTQPPPEGAANWPTLAANPQRTSWSTEQVTGNLHLEWYRPVEAYIPQNVQIIASDGLLYVATARGLYVLNAANGSLAWRYDTELPLGNSPTVSNGVVYFGGYDRKLYALNAVTGQFLWSYTGAKAGYNTNPLVVDGRVIIGNRDGSLYAVGEHGTASQGQLLWKFQAGGSIRLTAAYKDGIVYFAASDNHAYAVRANNGTQLWKSSKLPGDGYQSYWPVIYQDKVIFSASISYRAGIDPGTRSIELDGTPYDNYRSLEAADLFFGEPDGTLLGPVTAAQSWSNGQPVINAARISQYLENNPASDAQKYKPWRRMYVILNQSNGTEYTYDSDGDGYQEYLPAAYWGTNSGNSYPPIVGWDGLLYVNNIYQKTGDSQGKVMGWKIGTSLFNIVGGQGAIAEPQAISGGGNVVYRVLCCDRVGDYFDTRADGVQTNNLWSYDLEDQAINYDEMWTILPSWPRLWGWYSGEIASINSAYHNHGSQNVIIPHQGRLYVHRSNSVIAYGGGTVLGKLSTLTIAPKTDSPVTPTTTELKERLAAEVQKILDAGFLRPGYYNVGQFSLYKELSSYFDNPGDTLYTMSIAYPHLPATMQAQVKTYLQNYFAEYFNPNMYARVGWATGAARESMPIPPEVQASFADFPKSLTPGGFSWVTPPYNFYALWKYAQVEPALAGTMYTLAKNHLQVPVPSVVTTDWFMQRPYEHNAWMVGYIGFLNLQEQAGMAAQDSALRTQVTSELNRLLGLKWQIFSKDSYWDLEEFSYKKKMDMARNFIWMVPELGAYFRQNILASVQTAMNEYEYLAPYWFVSRYDADIGESGTAHLYNYHALFLTKAYILDEPYSELMKYLDVPAFERGDLFYLQNLIAAINAGQ